MKIFVSDIDGYVGAAVVSGLRKSFPEADVAGSSSAAVVTDGRVFATGSASAVAAAAGADLIVLSILSALPEALAVVEAIKEMSARTVVPDDPDEPLPLAKTVIGISTTLSWDRTTSMPLPWDEANYKRRRPGTRCAEVRDAEIAVIGSARIEVGLRCHVVAAGMPYGGGAGPMFPLLRRAWLCVDNALPRGPGAAALPAGASTGFPVPALRAGAPDGCNRLPTIHIKDLAAIVARVAVDSASLQPEGGDPDAGAYVLAVDDGSDTLLDICAALSRCAGVGGTRLLSREQAQAFFADPDAVDASVSAAVSSSAAGRLPDSGASAPASLGSLGGDPSLVASAPMYLSASAAFDPGSCAVAAALPADAWHSRGGLVAGMRACVAEFARLQALRPLRIVALAAPGAGGTRAAVALAAKYSLPLVTLAAAVARVRHGALRALSDGSAARNAALSALREAVERRCAEHDAAVAAAVAAAAAIAEGAAVGGKKGSGGKKEAAGKKGAAAASSAAAPSAGQAGDAAASGELAAAAALQARGPRLPRSLLLRVLRAHLTCPEARNKGWVLQGCPRSWAEAQALFGALPEGDDGVTPSEADALGITADDDTAEAGNGGGIGEEGSTLTYEAAAALLSAAGLALPPEAALAGALAAATAPPSAPAAAAAASSSSSSVVAPLSASLAAAREAVLDDALALREATAKGVSVAALGRDLTGHASGAAGAASVALGDDEAEDAAAAAAAAGDAASAALLAKRELNAALQPDAVLVLDADDAWIEQRAASAAAAPAGTDGAAALAAGGSSSSASASASSSLQRRLLRFRLHTSPSLTRTATTWLEAHARVELCELRPDALLAEACAALLAAGPTAAGSGPVSAAAAAVNNAADEDSVVAARVAAWAQQEPGAAAAAAPGAGFSLVPALPPPSAALCVPADLPSEPPLLLRAAAVADAALLKAAAPHLHRGGRPANFRPTLAEAAALTAARAAHGARRSVLAASSAAAHEAAVRSVRAAAGAEAALRAAAAQQAEAALLESRTAPLRAYLLEHVIPHVAAGLVHVCQRGPADPVDALADYLFKASVREEARARAAELDAAAAAAAAADGDGGAVGL